MHQPFHQHLQAPGGKVQRHGWGLAAGGKGALQRSMVARHAAAVHAQVALQHGAHVGGVFDLVGGDLEDAAGLLVGGNQAQRLQHGTADLGHGVG